MALLRLNGVACPHLVRKEGKRVRQWRLVSQNDGTNSWNWKSSNWNNNNKNNSNFVLPFFDTYGCGACGKFMMNRMIEHITYEEVRKAYFDCRRRKRNKESALQWELEYEINNYRLWKELNEGTYKIGPSICFCVTRPKIREVFAADFRDRIVHHLLMNRMLSIFEADFIGDTYNCRKGKGVYYGVQRVAEQAKNIGKDCWYLKIDLSGFFMCIDKDVLWRSVAGLLRDKWEGDDIDWWLSLLRQVIYNRPEQNCIKKGDVGLWDRLPKNKSLFYSNGRGLPIGNLTSQILANHYLTGFDKWLSSRVKGYGRYVDDIILLDTDKKKLLRLLPEIRKKLSELNLCLNERKTICQRADKGILFTGYVIQPWGVYPGNRLKNGAIDCAKSLEDIHKHLNRLNSYLGFLRQTLSYNIRNLIWNITVSRYPDEHLYAKEHINSIHKFKKTI